MTLTFAIRVAEDVLFGCLIFFCILVMLHPGEDGEVLVQSMVEFGAWDLNRIRLTIKVEDLV